MSTLKTTNIAHPSSASNNIVLDSSGGVDMDAFTVSGSAPADSVNLDASGRLLVGTSSNSVSSTIVCQGNSGSSSGEGIVRLNRGTAVPTSGQTLGAIVFGQSGSNDGAYILGEADAAWSASNDYPTRLTFSTTADGASSPTERMRIRSDGYLAVYSAYNNTTSNAANVFIGADSIFLRSTSSGKYKTDIEDIELSYSEALLGCRPVWYRSTCQNDNPDWGWWGFIAEEVAEIDPRLVYWKTVKVVHDEEGRAVETPCDPEPESVAYDRFVPHLLNLIKRQGEAIAELQAEVAALKAQ
jgi:hypothetical protein